MLNCSRRPTDLRDRSAQPASYEQGAEDQTSGLPAAAAGRIRTLIADYENGSSVDGGCALIAKAVCEHLDALETEVTGISRTARG